MGQDSINQRNLLIIQNQFFYRRHATKSRPTHFSLSINCNQIQKGKIVKNHEHEILVALREELGIMWNGIFMCLSEKDYLICDRLCESTYVHVSKFQNQFIL